MRAALVLQAAVLLVLVSGAVMPAAAHAEANRWAVFGTKAGGQTIRVGWLRTLNSCERVRASLVEQSHARVRLRVRLAKVDRPGEDCDFRPDVDSGPTIVEVRLPKVMRGQRVSGRRMLPASARWYGFGWEREAAAEGLHAADAVRMLRGLGVERVQIDGPRDGYVVRTMPTLPRRSLPTSVTLTTR